MNGKTSLSLSRSVLFRLGRLAMLLSAGMTAGWAHAADTPAGAEAPPKPAWDQAANIRDAAERLGNLQKTRGATGAFAFIEACYRTHGLASDYSQAFEACIAQDYLETKVLATVYSRLPPEALEKLKAPSPQALADSMGRRIVAAFSQYKVSVAYAEDFKKLVDVHGFPVFMKTIFPDANIPNAEGGRPPTDDPTEEKK